MSAVEFTHEMWTCPTCKRTFKTKNQSHSCVMVNPDDLFMNKPQVIQDVYKELFRRCAEFCHFETDTTKSCIYFVDKQRFLVLKPKSSGLILEFILHRKEDIFPVINTFEIGKNRFVHRLKLDTLIDINDQVLGWIKDAHLLTKS